MLPDDAGGKPIVLVLGFARESEWALYTWGHKLLAAVGAKAQIYVVIVADSGPFFSKRKMKKKIAGSAFATQAQLENGILVTFQGAGWRDLVPAGPGKDAGIVVADATGNVVFAKREPYSDQFWRRSQRTRVRSVSGRSQRNQMGSISSSAIRSLS